MQRETSTGARVFMYNATVYCVYTSCVRGAHIASCYLPIGCHGSELSWWMKACADCNTHICAALAFVSVFWNGSILDSVDAIKLAFSLTPNQSRINLVFMWEICQYGLVHGFPVLSMRMLGQTFKISRHVFAWRIKKTMSFQERTSVRNCQTQKRAKWHLFPSKNCRILNGMDCGWQRLEVQCQFASIQLWDHCPRNS